ncbi:MAG: FAD-binding domain-containing protein [Pseudomonadota bacterium]
MTIDLFPEATRTAGLERMKAFAPKMGREYASGRNADPGAELLLDNDEGAVSVLSPFVRHRLVTEREAVETALSRFSYSTAEKFIQEVCWRTYWKGWLELRPSIWRDYLEARDHALRNVEHDSDLRERFETAITGRTGLECFDHWIGELKDTGYLHNHTRMWFASIWVYTLDLPWALGADIFMKHLADADAASNTLSWRWVCGLQTKGKTYLARASNIARYTNGRFNPQWQLATDAPALDGPPHPPASMLAAEEPIIGERIGFLITDEDCHPMETLSGMPSPVAIASVFTADTRSPNGAGAVEFSKAALADASQRVSNETGLEVSVLSPAELKAWADENELDAVVTSWIPTGPTRDAVTSTGISLTERRRTWDNAFWPHATRGFFPFKEKIPSVLADLGMDVAPPRRKSSKKRAHR